MFNIDERRPTCERCDKSSYACLGYGDNRLAFVHMTTGQTDYSKLEQCHEETTPSRKLLYTAGDHTKSLANLYMKASTNYVSSPLHLRAHLEEIIVSHLMWKLPVDPHEVSLDQSDLPNLSAILASCDHGSPAYFSGLSSAAALFSRTYRIDGMAEWSVRLYSRALQLLHRDMQSVSEHMDRTKAYINLWSIALLSVYEMTLPTSLSKWKIHGYGLSALVRN